MTDQSGGAVEDAANALWKFLEQPEDDSTNLQDQEEPKRALYFDAARMVINCYLRGIQEDLGELPSAP